MHQDAVCITYCTYTSCIVVMDAVVYSMVYSAYSFYPLGCLMHMNDEAALLHVKLRQTKYNRWFN